jgi:hypothetical protein
MFHRVEMDVVPMAVEILLISNGMFPETPLPDGSFPSAQAVWITDFSRSDPVQIKFGEQPFDLFPTDGIIRITLWQDADAVEMVRQ